MAFLSSQEMRKPCACERNSLSLATTAISNVRGNAVKHGDMCGLNATNPLDARTPPPFCPWWSALSSAHAKEQKQLPNGSQDGVEAWACDMVLIGKRLEGCDKMRQAHQARLASGGDFSTYFSPTTTFTLPLHSNQQ
jgi:hypothetical protein